MCSFCPKAPQSFPENNNDAKSASLGNSSATGRAKAKSLLLHSSVSFRPSAPDKQAQEAMVQGTVCFSPSCKMLRRLSKEYSIGKRRECDKKT
jgi:hypothetical protein